MKRVLAIVAAVVLGAGLVGGCRCTSSIDAVRLNQEAMVYYRNGQHEQAEELLKKSLDMDFENPATHYWLGQCYELKGKNERAIYEYELATRFGPSMELGELGYLRLLHRTGEVDASVQATRVYMRHRGGRAAELVVLAKQLADEGLGPQAVVVFQRAQELEPHNAEPSMALAEMYFSKGKDEQGVEALTAAFLADPYHPGLAERLGKLGRRVEIPPPPGFPTPAMPPIKRQLYDLD